MTRRQISIAARGALGVVGVRLGRAEHGQQAVALELVDVPAVSGDHRDDHLEQPVERADDLLRLGAGREAGEVLDVGEQDRDVELDPLLVEAVGEDVLRDLAVEVGAEGVADPLALGQPLDHLVERRRELADLVARRDRDRAEKSPAMTASVACRRSAIGRWIDFESRTVSSSAIVVATPTAIATSRPRSAPPPPSEVSAATVRPVMMLISGSVSRRRQRSGSADRLGSVRGVTCWLMSTSTGRRPISSAK